MIVDPFDYDHRVDGHLVMNTDQLSKPDEEISDSVGNTTAAE
jgi:hypothetical protein